MQMLEDELGVTLFERRKNKLSFTETDHQTVKLTKKILKQKFLDDVQHFALKESTIFGDVNAPGAIFELKSRIKEKGLEQHIQIEQKTNDELEKALDDENVHFIVTDYPIKKSIFFPWGNFTYPFP
ncbi:LysR family transcriptional regulator [Streptococcus anginosus]|uniref:LysR family transcriptional regulator n=1 Tax=Streptococcus anginosus TaxID=1328 RepID=UPI0022E33DBD|nr:LysR family transcriptional regulator [Streptococcus anginosus]